MGSIRSKPFGHFLFQSITILLPFYRPEERRMRMRGRVSAHLRKSGTHLSQHLPQRLGVPPFVGQRNKMLSYRRNGE